MGDIDSLTLRALYTGEPQQRRRAVSDMLITVEHLDRQVAAALERLLLAAGDVTRSEEVMNAVRDTVVALGRQVDREEAEHEEEMRDRSFGQSMFEALRP